MPGFDEDDLLAAQLASLDAIDTRTYTTDPQPYTAPGAPVAVESPGSRRGLDAFPAAGTVGDAVAGWLDASMAVLEERLSGHREELDRLASQWAHALTHMARLEPDDVADLVEAQARRREELAADDAVLELLRELRADLGSTSGDAHPARLPAVLRRWLGGRP